MVRIGVFARLSSVATFVVVVVAAGVAVAGAETAAGAPERLVLRRCGIFTLELKHYKLKAGAQTQTMAATSTEASKISFTVGTIEDLQRPDQKFALVQVLHKDQGIKSSDGKPWIRILGLFATREAARARVASLVSGGANAQEIRLIPTCGPFLIGSQKYHDVLVPDRVGGSSYIDMETRTRENVKVTRLMNANERKRARDRAEMRENVAHRRMGIVENDFIVALDEDTDGVEPTADHSEFRAIFYDALHALERLNQETDDQAETGGASESKDSSADAAPHLAPARAAAPAAPVATAALPEVRSDQTVRSQNYAVIGIIDDLEIIQAQKTLARRYLEARDAHYDMILNDLIESTLRERGVSRVDYETYRLGHFLKYCETSAWPALQNWERQRQRMFQSAKKFVPERFTMESTFEDILLEPVPTDGSIDPTATTEDTTMPFKNWLRRNPKPPMPTPEDIPSNILGLEDAEARVWWHLWDENFRRARWTEFLSMEIPNRAELMRDWYAANPKPVINELPQQEPVVAIIAAFNTDEEAKTFVEDRARRLEGLKDWYLGCIAMYECVPILAHTDKRVRTMYHHKELQQLADAERESETKRAELEFKAKSAGKKFKTVDVYGTDLTVANETSGEVRVLPAAADAGLTPIGDVPAESTAAAAAAAGPVVTAAAAPSRKDLDKFRFEFRDLDDALSKEFHKDKPETDD